MLQSVVQLEGLLRVLRHLEKNLPAAPQVAKFSKFAIHRTIDHSGGTRSYLGLSSSQSLEARTVVLIVRRSCSTHVKSSHFQKSDNLIQ
jgi:hypothetical protein